MERCNVRVSDNGDSIECEKPIIAKFDKERWCSVHLQKELARLKVIEDEARKFLKELRRYGG